MLEVSNIADELYEVLVRNMEDTGARTLLNAHMVEAKNPDKANFLKGYARACEDYSVKLRAFMEEKKVQNVAL